MTATTARAQSEGVGEISDERTRRRLARNTERLARERAIIGHYEQRMNEMMQQTRDQCVRLLEKTIVQMRINATANSDEDDNDSVTSASTSGFNLANEKLIVDATAESMGLRSIKFAKNVTPELMKVNVSESSNGGANALTSFSILNQPMERLSPGKRSNVTNEQCDSSISRSIDTKRQRAMTDEVIDGNLLARKLKFTRIERDHWLTEDCDFFLWKGRIVDRLRSADVEFLINVNIRPVIEYSDWAIKIMNTKVRDFIKSSMTEKFEKSVENCETPADILMKLEREIAPKSETTSHAILATINNIKFTRTQTVRDFLATFDELVNKLRRCPGMNYTEANEKRNLLMAVGKTFQSISMRERVMRDTGAAEMTIREIREMMYSEELEENEYIRRDGGGDDVAMTASSRSSSKKEQEQICFGCGAYGHLKSNCPNPGLRKCYNCKEMTASHISANCPNRRGKYSRARSISVNSAITTPATRFATSTTEQHLGRPRSGNAIRKSNTVLRNRRQGIRKMNLRDANRMAKRRANTGRAQLNFMSGSQEDLVYLEADDFSESESEVEVKKSAKTVRFANVNEDSSDDDGDNDDGQALATINSKLKPNVVKFIIDTGATDHIVNEKCMFIELRQLAKSRRITCANKDREADLNITHAGDILVKVANNKLGCLSNVLFSEGLTENLFALRRLRGSGLTTAFEDDSVRICDKKTGEMIKTGFYCGKFWWLLFDIPFVNANSDTRRQMIKNVREFKKRKNSVLAATLDLGGSTGEPLNKVGRTEFKEEDLKAIEANRTKRECEGLLWHYRLNHASKDYLEIAAKNYPSLEKVNFPDDIRDCEVCKMAKAKRKPFVKKRTRAEKSLQRIHSDLMGPIKPYSIKKSYRYIVTFIDDYSRFAVAFPLQDKTLVHVALANFIKGMRVLIGDSEAKILEMRIDGGREYMTDGMKAILHREGIQVQVTAPGTPQHNGCAERINLEIAEKVRANLLSARMPHYYWDFALEYTMFVHNRTPNKSIDFRIPFEVLTNRKANISNLRRFGCEAYSLDLKANKTKFAARANKGFIVGCTDTHYLVLDAKEKIVIKSKHVDCIEAKVYGDSFGKDSYLPLHKEIDFASETNKEQAMTESGKAYDQEEEECVENYSGKNVDEISENIVNEKIEKMASITRSGDKENKGETITTDDVKIGEDEEFEYYQQEIVDVANDESDTVMFALNVSEQDPEDYQDAIKSSDSEEWQKAINEEYDAHTRCETWKLVKRSSLPKNTKVIKARWVNRKKSEAKGKIRYRSRLVAKGFADKNYYDRTEIYAPVARLSDVRFILATAAKFKLKLHQLDVKTAFLNGTLEKPVYMEMPDGLCEYLGKSREFKGEYVCKLKRALYGLKVSPKRWFVKFKATMVKLGFESYPFQACLFTWRKGDKYIILLLYVDDILMATNCDKRLNEVIEKLEHEFKITDLGTPEKFLGMEIERTENGDMIKLHQTKFIGKIIKRFNMCEAKTVDTPISTNINSRRINDDEMCEDVPYRQAIGCLLFLSNGTRPDITFAVNKASRKQSNYTLRDWTDVKRILRYLKGNSSLGLIFSGKGNKLQCYADASFGINDEQSRSTSGYALFLFGDLVNWRTKRQNHIALSSAEAEYVALSLAIRDVTNFSEMCKRINLVKIDIEVFEDNMTTIEMSKTDESQSLKHLVKVKYHYVRNEVREGRVHLVWISTDQQIGDFFTKALSSKKFRYFRDKLVQ